MSNQLRQLESIEQKVKSLLNKYNKVNGENQILKEENERLKSNSILQKEKINELENQLNVLKLAKNVSGDGDENERAELKRKINEMVKEIDMCVALLNN
jgi:predicted  nucleic acid-binding Zn-ribbon protein